jgi:hypothetical protein
VLFFLISLLLQALVSDWSLLSFFLSADLQDINLCSTVNMAPTTSPVNTDWQAVALRVKKRIDSAIPPSYYASPSLIPTQLDDSVVDFPRRADVLSLREIEITELNAVDLLPKIWEKKYSAVEVARAFCKRAVIAHQVVSRLFHSLKNFEIDLLCTLLGLGRVENY